MRIFFAYRNDVLCCVLSVLFCLLSLLISERFSGLISIGSIHLVTTAGFVADQLMGDKHCILYIICRCLFKWPSLSTCSKKIRDFRPVFFLHMIHYYCNPESGTPIDSLNICYICTNIIRRSRYVLIFLQTPFSKKKMFV